MGLDLGASGTLPVSIRNGWRWSREHWPSVLILISSGTRIRVVLVDSVHVASRSRIGVPHGRVRIGSIQVGESVGVTGAVVIDVRVGVGVCVGVLVSVLVFIPLRLVVV